MVVTYKPNKSLKCALENGPANRRPRNTNNTYKYMTPIDYWILHTSSHIFLLSAFLRGQTWHGNCTWRAHLTLNMRLSQLLISSRNTTHSILLQCIWSNFPGSVSTYKTKLGRRPGESEELDLQSCSHHCQARVLLHIPRSFYSNYIVIGLADKVMN